MARMKPGRYEVDIETFGPPPDEEVLESFPEVLASVGLPGAVASAGGLGGGIGATLSIDRASSVVEATDEALRLFEAACEKIGFKHDGIARVDVMTEPYFDRWLDQEPERYAGVSEIAALFGVSRQRVAELREKPGFPAPVAELAAGPVWTVSSLTRFLEEWERRPGRPRRTA